MIPLTNAVWRFDQSNNLDSVSWTAPDYDDSHWQSGPSLLGYETSSTLLPLIRTSLVSPLQTGVSCGQGHAYYFRIHFHWPYPPNSVTLFLTNRVDDGAKFFLNGMEVANLRMYSGATYCLTFTANGEFPPGPNNDADSDEVLEIPGTHLRQGDNVLAVSVHQAWALSSDIVFGCAVTAIRWTPPILTDPAEPTNRTVRAYASTTLRVLASGYPPPTYQWFRESSPILDATNATLVISNMMPWHAGAYFCTVSNPLGDTESRTATVTYTDDSDPPQLISARTDEFFNTVVVTFDELVASWTAEDSSNYSLDGGLWIIGAMLSSDGRSVTLDFGPEQWLAENTNYTLTVNGVSDLAGNPITADSTVTFRTYALARGFLNIAIYDTGPGEAVPALIYHPTYPNSPQERLFLPAFDTRTVYPDDRHDNYGARITGLFIPPQSGNWIFFLSSDDASELWLNPAGAYAAGKILLTRETTCCHPFSTSIMSLPVPLIGGQHYYLEALYKEGAGGDYCRVAAKLEADPTAPEFLTPIPGSQLGCYVDTNGVALTITQQPTDQMAIVPATPTMVAVEDFTSQDGAFSVISVNHPGKPWAYDASTGTWKASDQEACATAFRSSRLNSPVYTITTGGRLTLSFTHRYSFEFDASDGSTWWDGGQVRISVNGGLYARLPGTNFTAHGYNGAVGGAYVPNNDLAGQEAFVADSPNYGSGFITSTATLGPYNAGDTLSVQFFGAWDDCIEGTEPNWEIDSVGFDPPVQRLGAEVPVTFTVQASAFRPGMGNAPLAYQWQRHDGAGFVDLPQGTSASFSLRPYLADDGAQFRCIVRTPGLCVTSQVARLTVVTDSGEPRLSIGQAGGAVTVSWSLPATGWVLEQTATLTGATIPWSPVPAAQYQTNATHISITVPAPVGNRFYRLRKL